MLSRMRSFVASDRKWHEARSGSIGVGSMSTTLQSAVESYARARNLSSGSRSEYAATVKSGPNGATPFPLSNSHAGISENSSTGFTNRQSQKTGRTPAARPTKRERTCEQSCRGRGRRICLKCCPGFLHRGNSETSSAVTT